MGLAWAVLLFKPRVDGDEQGALLGWMVFLLVMILRLDRLPGAAASVNGNISGKEWGSGGFVWRNLDFGAGGPRADAWVMGGWEGLLLGGRFGRWRFGIGRGGRRGGL